ncbi:TVP38/TMEM64 family protein [Sutcliffiella cohnii]
MNDLVVKWLQEAGIFATLFSILLNILVSVAGIIPSFFVTAANITVFGLYQGLIISYLGESLGAIISFYLYRKGIQQFKPRWLRVNKHKRIIQLQQTKGLDAFYLILLLRLLPFFPSGLVNFAAALSKTSLLTFGIASSIGKIPAIVIEAYSVYFVLESSVRTQLILISLTLLLFILNKVHQNNEREREQLEEKTE